jgi:O-antigen/teichoic acid export membrane protein
MLRNLAVVLRGTIIAQALGIAILPLLTRLFLPEAFGHYQVFQSILVVLVITASFRFELLILRVKEEEVARTVRISFLLSVLLTCALTALILSLLAAGWPPQLLSLPFTPLLFPLGLLVAGLTQTYSYKLTRDQNYRQVVRTKLVQVVAYAGVALTIGALRPTLDGIIIADICGRLASAAYVYALSRRANVKLFDFPSFAETRDFIVANRSLPMLSLPGAFLNSLGAAITPIMIYGHFSPGVSGQFGLVERSLSLPLAMVVMAISQVYMGQMSALLRAADPAAVRHFDRVVLGTAALAVLPAVLLFPFLPVLFETVFGGQWRMAGQFAQLLLPAYAFSLIFGSINQTLIAMGRYGYQLLWDCAWPLLIGLLWFFVVQFGLGPSTAVAMHSAAVSVLGVSFLLLARWLISRFFRDTALSPAPAGTNGGGLEPHRIDGSGVA